jgi:hypothetical protein
VIIAIHGNARSERIHFREDSNSVNHKPSGFVFGEG